LKQDTMVTTADRLDDYLGAYGQLRALAKDREPVWLQQLREDAWTRFSAKGFPTTHDEDWRFTNLAVLAKTTFHRAAKTDAKHLAQEIAAFRLAGAACQLVFVNGHFAPELSQTANLPGGLEVCGLAKALDHNAKDHAPEGIEQHLGRYADVRRDGLRP